MHIYIPCAGIKYGNAGTIAENICQAVHELVPSITTMSASVNSRGDKLYLDPSQNDYADRLAAAYSVRAYKDPTVSTPLDWKELKTALDPGQLDVTTIKKRIEKKGDIWANLLDKKTAVKNA
jgi:bifunctional non-homologous end joining protein LigD